MQLVEMAVLEYKKVCQKKMTYIKIDSQTSPKVQKFSNHNLLNSRKKIMSMKVS